MKRMNRKRTKRNMGRNYSTQGKGANGQNIDVKGRQSKNRKKKKIGKKIKGRLRFPGFLSKAV